MKEPAEAEGKPKIPAAEARGAAQKGVREDAAENPGVPRSKTAGKQGASEVLDSREAKP